MCGTGGAAFTVKPLRRAGHGFTKNAGVCEMINASWSTCLVRSLTVINNPDIVDFQIFRYIPPKVIACLACRCEQVTPWSAGGGLTVIDLL